MEFCTSLKSRSQGRRNTMKLGALYTHVQDLDTQNLQGLVVTTGTHGTLQ